MAQAEMPVIDQTVPEGFKYPKPVESEEDSSSDDDASKADDIAKEDDPDALFAEEREGWRG
jgi:hypothetical protein